MLIRIVRMTFQEDKVEDFIEVFNQSKDLILNFEGCRHLELHQDYHQPNIFATYSIWQNDASLDNYRHSELFEAVWAKTKPLFREKPFAFSNRLYMKVGS